MINILLIFESGGLFMKDKKVIFYVIGSIVLFVTACFIIPKITKKITNKIFKESQKKYSDENDDWGPEFVKKSEDF